MKRTFILAATLLLAFPAGAMAYCDSNLANQASAYGDIGVDRTLCMQQGVAGAADRAAEQARIDAQLGNMQIQLDRLQQTQDSMILQRPLPNP